jgi:tRNA(His) guanylyltransferase
MDKTTIGDRMKGYEGINERFLTRRIPVILRLDGRAFHTVTRKLFGRGYNIAFSRIMQETALAVQEQIQGCEFCYGQSDEISFLLTDYRKITSEGWFCYNLNKILSISSSITSVKFSKLSEMDVEFDSRAFNIPKDEVCNYMLWRQQDATRNAIQMAGREQYSQKQLHGKSCSDIQELLFQKGVNFNDYPTERKRGWSICKGIIDNQIPIFSQDRNYIEKFVYIRED